MLVIIADRVRLRTADSVLLDFKQVVNNAGSALAL